MPVLSIIRFLLPRKRLHFPGGGTEATTGSGLIRWTYYTSFREYHDREVETFQREIMESEPAFRFEPFARMFRKAPEAMLETWRPKNADYSRVVSREGERFLKELARLHDKRPATAIKIAGLAHHSIYERSAFAKQLWAQLIDWVERPDLRSQRIDAGLSIWLLWPKNPGPEVRAPSQNLDAALVRAYRAYADEAPDFVMDRIRKTWKVHGYGAIGLFDDPNVCVDLSRKLVSVEPNFAKAMLAGCLWKVRIYGAEALSFDPVEIAEELFSLEDRHPHQTARDQGVVFNALVVDGPSQAACWRPSLDRLLAAACAATDHQVKGSWFRTVAINAPTGSEVSAPAIQEFHAWANAFPDLSSDDYRTIMGHADTLVQTLIGLTDDRSVMRNTALLPAPLHPLCRVAEDAYWGYVDALLAASNPRTMTVLGRAIEGAVDTVSVRSMDRLAEVFDRLAPVAPKIAADTFYSLGHSSTLIYQPPREKRPERCREAFSLIRPLMYEISPELAQQAERNAFRHWSE